MFIRNIDGLLGRMVHSAARPGDGHASVTEKDRAILASVEQYLQDGILLKRWWEQADARGYRERFELSRNFNRPDSSYGFFDEISLPEGTIPIMGNVQEMFYDQPRVPREMRGPAIEWLQLQLREFVLHYFMRVSSFRQPEAFVESDRLAANDALGRFSWCTRDEIRRTGFGFSQLFYKLRATGEIGQFTGEAQSAIVDLREIGTKYEWIIAKVRIFDFSFRFKPAGPGGPEVVFGLNEESYLVLSRDFIADMDHPEPGVLGCYGIGYAFIKSPDEALITYGPGQFDAAFESIQFRVLESGEIRVRMVFVVNRPRQIANVPIDPIGWGYWAANVFSLGLTSRIFANVKDLVDQLKIRVGSFDPVYAYLALINTLTAGWAGQNLCMSKEQLDKDFLAQHFLQHYQAVVGSLLTWRQISDWLDPASLPQWVIVGKSS
jgi:hypothetical protein